VDLPGPGQSLRSGRRGPDPAGRLDADLRYSLLVARPGARNQIAVRMAKWLALKQLDLQRKNKGDLAVARTLAID
jgi:hypothetical protein